MKLAEYLSQPNTPAAQSPVGSLMVCVLQKFPGITFEAARAKARDLLDEAAGRRIYRIPTVYSEAEQARRLKDLRQRFAKLSPAA